MDLQCGFAVWIFCVDFRRGFFLVWILSVDFWCGFAPWIWDVNLLVRICDVDLDVDLSVDFSVDFFVSEMFKFSLFLIRFVRGYF